MDQIGKYFRQKQDSYQLFFVELMRVIQNLGKECQLSIDQQYSRVMNSCSNQFNSAWINAKIQQLKAHRQLQFKSIVDLLIIALKQIPDNIVNRYQSPSIGFKTVQLKGIPQYTPSAKFGQPINYTSNMQNGCQSRILVLKQQQQTIQVRNKNIIQSQTSQKGSKVSQSIQSKKSRNKSNNVNQSSNQKKLQSYLVNKLNPKIFELPKSKTKTLPKDDKRQQSLGINEGNKNSLIKVIELFSNNENQTDQKINFKTCRQLDKKIYNQANEYLQNCKNKYMNKRISSPVKRVTRSNSRVDSTINKLGITQNKDFEGFTIIQTIKTEGYGFNQRKPH